MHRKLFAWLLLIASLLNVWLPGGRAWSQSTVEILTSSVAYQFGESLTFQAVFRADQQIQEVHVLFNSADGAFSGSGKAQTVSDKSYAYTYGLENSSLRPFSRVDYRFQVLLADGTLVNTSDRSFIYRDNRFEWFTAAEDNLTVRLDRADPAFAAETLEVAQAALERIRELGVIAPQENVEIYVYSSAASMQEALDLIGPGWSAGHANPDLGIVLVTLPQGPQQRLVMEQRIPHELMHVMLFRMLGAGYFLLPAWLSEGLATAAELYPNPDYQVLLEDARQAGKLLNFSSLCEIFPRETSQTLLAYAQAGSFVRFLENRFGSAGIQALLNSYASGTDCVAGTEAALGQPLNRLEREWRQEVFGENPTWLLIGNLMPWIVILIAVLSAPVALFFYAWRKRPVITT